MQHFFVAIFVVLVWAVGAMGYTNEDLWEDLVFDKEVSMKSLKKLKKGDGMIKEFTTVDEHGGKVDLPALDSFTIVKKFRNKDKITDIEIEGPSPGHLEIFCKLKIAKGSTFTVLAGSSKAFTYLCEERRCKTRFKGILKSHITAFKAQVYGKKNKFKCFVKAVESPVIPTTIITTSECTSSPGSETSCSGKHDPTNSYYEESPATHSDTSCSCETTAKHSDTSCSCETTAKHSDTSCSCETTATPPCSGGHSDTDSTCSCEQTKTTPLCSTTSSGDTTCSGEHNTTCSCYVTYSNSSCSCETNATSTCYGDYNDTDSTTCTCGQTETTPLTETTCTCGQTETTPLTETTCTCGQTETTPLTETTCSYKHDPTSSYYEESPATGQDTSCSCETTDLSSDTSCSCDTTATHSDTSCSCETTPKSSDTSCSCETTTSSTGTSRTCGTTPTPSDTSCSCETTPTSSDTSCSCETTTSSTETSCTCGTTPTPSNTSCSCETTATTPCSGSHNYTDTTYSCEPTKTTPVNGTECSGKHNTTNPAAPSDSNLTATTAPGSNGSPGVPQSSVEIIILSTGPPI